MKYLSKLPLYICIYIYIKHTNELSFCLSRSSKQIQMPFLCPKGKRLQRNEKNGTNQFTKKQKKQQQHNHKTAPHEILRKRKQRQEIGQGEKETTTPKNKKNSPQHTINKWILGNRNKISDSGISVTPASFKDASCKANCGNRSREGRIERHPLNL